MMTCRLGNNYCAVIGCDCYQKAYFDNHMKKCGPLDSDICPSCSVCGEDFNGSWWYDTNLCLYVCVNCAKQEHNKEGETRR